MYQVRTQDNRLRRQTRNWGLAHFIAKRATSESYGKHSIYKDGELVCTFTRMLDNLRCEYANGEAEIWDLFKAPSE